VQKKWRTRVFLKDLALDSRNHFFEKNAFLKMRLFFVFFPLQFNETPTMVGLKMFQTVYKRTLCEHNSKH